MDMEGCLLIKPTCCRQRLTTITTTTKKKKKFKDYFNIVLLLCLNRIIYGLTKKIKVFVINKKKRSVAEFLLLQFSLQNKLID